MAAPDNPLLPERAGLCRTARVAAAARHSHYGRTFRLHTVAGHPRAGRGSRAAAQERRHIARLSDRRYRDQRDHPETRPERADGNVSTNAARPLHVRVHADVRRRPQFHAGRADRARARRSGGGAMSPLTRSIAWTVGSVSALTASVLVVSGQGPKPGDPLPGITPAEFIEFRLG